jgi:hypothetical protein
MWTLGHVTLPIWQLPNPFVTQMVHMDLPCLAQSPTRTMRLHAHSQAVLYFLHPLEVFDSGQQTVVVPVGARLILAHHWSGPCHLVWSRHRWYLQRLCLEWGSLHHVAALAQVAAEC